LNPKHGAKQKTGIACDIWNYGLLEINDFGRWFHVKEFVYISQILYDKKLVKSQNDSNYRLPQQLTATARLSLT